MEETVVRKVTDMLSREISPSRNRSFDRYADPLSFKAFRLFRLIRNLEDELVAAGDDLQVWAEPESGPDRTGEIKVVVEDRIVRYQRFCFLPRKIFVKLVERLRRRGVALEMIG